MILPGTYANGFAPRDGRPLYPELWRGCVGAWNPGLGVSGLTLRDWSGFGNDGTLTNGPTWAASQGKYAVKFSGSTSESVLGTKGAITSAMRPITISWCYQASSLSASRHWVYQNTVTSPNPNLGVVIERISDSSHKLGLYSGNYVYSSAFNWDMLSHHYAIVWLADDAVHFYRDGILVGSTTKTVGGNAPDATWQWSRLGSGIGGFSLTGSIIEMMKHTRALSPQEIRTLATRRGIAYEMAPRRRSSAQVTTNRLRRVLIGS